MNRIAPALLALGLLACSAGAQTWPTRPVRLVVPYAPGSSPDVLARLVNEKTGKALGQPLIIENRPGAGGNTGTDHVAKAAPDGYTFLMSTNGPLVYNTVLIEKLPYDPFRDLAPVTLAGWQPNVCAVSNNLKADTVAQWIEAMRKNPGKFNFSSTGVGSMSHLSIEILKLKTSSYAVHLPYSSSPQAITAIVQGDVHFACVPPVAVMPQAKAGRIRALAVTSPERFETLKELPTMKELGYPEIQAMAWMAVMAPARTPADIVGRMNRELVTALRDRDTREKLAGAYMEPVGGTAEELSRFMKEELERWSPVIRHYSSAEVK